MIISFSGWHINCVFLSDDPRQLCVLFYWTKKRWTEKIHQQHWTEPTIIIESEWKGKTLGLDFALIFVLIFFFTLNIFNGWWYIWHATEDTVKQMRREEANRKYLTWLGNWLGSNAWKKDEKHGKNFTTLLIPPSHIAFAHSPKNR